MAPPFLTQHFLLQSNVTSECSEAECDREHLLKDSASTSRGEDQGVVRDSAIVDGKITDQSKSKDKIQDILCLVNVWFVASSLVEMTQKCVANLRPFSASPEDPGQELTIEEMRKLIERNEVVPTASAGLKPYNTVNV
jgi:hypothetical protein